MIKKIIVLVGALLMLNSCDQNEEIDAQRKGIMQFQMEVGSNTRVNGNMFESMDAVGIYVVQFNGNNPAPLQLSGNWANNIKTVYDGTNWKTVDPIFWCETKADVYGYYPYMKINSVDECAFSVQLDQNTASTVESIGGYEASDFLWAKTSNVAKENMTVSLTYKHIMSRLVVNLVKGDKYEGELPDISDLYIHNVIPDAVIDLHTGTALKSSKTITKSIKARKVSASKFEAIIVPQRIQKNIPLIEYISNGVSYLMDSNFYFKSGKEHIINLVVNGNPDQISIEIGGQIDNNW